MPEVTPPFGEPQHAQANIADLRVLVESMRTEMRGEFQRFGAKQDSMYRLLHGDDGDAQDQGIKGRLNALEASKKEQDAYNMKLKLVVFTMIVGVVGNFLWNILQTAIENGAPHK